MKIVEETVPALLIFFTVGALGLLFALRFAVNLTPSSAPAGIYRLHPTPPRRGDRVVTCLPEVLGRFGRVRGYLGRGLCPGGARRVGKRLVAFPGDRVELAEDGLAVNGAEIPGTARLRRDSAGRFLPALPVGTYLVPPGKVWLVSTFDSRSWDSRYFGAVPVDSEGPVLTPGWIWGEESSEDTFRRSAP